MKQALKSISRLFALLGVLPILAIYHGFRPFWGDSIFASCSQSLSLLPGKIGSYLRVAFYRHTMTACNPDCVIGFGTLFSHADTEIGEGVYIGPQCNIGSCRIERDCLIASGVFILSGKQQHQFEHLEIPIQQQGGKYQKIHIGEDSWIGNGALIMANVGRKSIVGAGSVVNEEVQEMSIVAGNPARLIRSRN